jgi:four helix bundle protein
MRFCENMGCSFQRVSRRFRLLGHMNPKHTTPPLTYSLAIELVRTLRPTLALLGRHDPSLQKQLLRALTSIPLNAAEAGSRIGKDRAHLFRVAYGSLREVNACLEVAVALGWLATPVVAGLRDRLGAVLYGAQR